ncbi:phosphocholine-specific phospholipase C [Paraburkholderia susongensis]|uniref:phospholipase C n=1 Tax=Paraburkholderia susongensis TaxID=1515439 RepID=A0A1X7M0L3_9BURK|nr:phospholipase C, phosphocholine-specific [Paraburkholderia susongensis]SMG59726.1 phospholipase C [Paraburkholderia susongensis]
MNSGRRRKLPDEPACPVGESSSGPARPRRNFLRMTASSLGASTAAALLPAWVREALAIPAKTTTGTIDDVQHIVIFTQENRSFDHYFGKLRGVRGFNDRMAIRLPNGDPVWKQPAGTHYILPFHTSTATTSATCAKAPSMSYLTDIAMWNKGLCNAWNTARQPGLGMSYFSRDDLRFYYALADAFTICDQYYASTFTQTNPNRLHLFSGSSGLSAGFDPSLDNAEPTQGFKWQTVAEMLETAGVSWRVYQQTDNFDDNALALFHSFKSAVPTSALYRKGMATVNDIAQAFAADVASGKLPQVSWIIAPTALSEHANYHPQAGEDLSARLLAALASNPEVWSRTVFLLNYDEQGGFFDHAPPPTPPGNDAEGKTTVATTGELYNGLPIGLGFRVPMTVISPWSRGGYVCSEVFDHTSIIRFIERRFRLHCRNISAWRRAICGDLTSAFNFNNPDSSWPALPDTSAYVASADQQCSSLPAPMVPTVQSMPKQEPGTRPSRALPYEFHANAGVDAVNGTFSLLLINSGKTGAAFSAYDLATGTRSPRRYALDPGTQLSDSWTRSQLNGTKYWIALHGANGFLRTFRGDFARKPRLKTAEPEIGVSYDVANNAICVTMRNSGRVGCRFTVRSNAYRTGKSQWIFFVPAGGNVSKSWPVSASGNWYDFSVTVDTQSAFLRRFAGRLENGHDLVSDPAAA